VVWWLVLQANGDRDYGPASCGVLRRKRFQRASAPRFMAMLVSPHSSFGQAGKGCRAEGVPRGTFSEQSGTSSHERARENERITLPGTSTHVDRPSAAARGCGVTSTALRSLSERPSPGPTLGLFVPYWSSHRACVVQVAERAACPSGSTTGPVCLGSGQKIEGGRARRIRTCRARHIEGVWFNEEACGVNGAQPWTTRTAPLALDACGCRSFGRGTARLDRSLSWAGIGFDLWGLPQTRVRTSRK
jgi:hypothetical protein